MKAPDEEDRELRDREFVRLLEEHERQLAAYIHTLVPRWQDAEDVLQNTKLRLWEQFGSFQLNTDFPAWAFTVARYMVQTHRKQRKRQRVCFSDQAIERIARHIPAVSSSVHNGRLLALVECAKTLSEASLTLLRHFCTRDRKIKDIALDLGQTPSATYSSLFRIRRSLLECVRKREREEQEP